MKTLLLAPAFFLAAMAASVAAPVHAQQPASAGIQIANNGTPDGVAACASCHGAKGEGNAASNFPRIAGQSQNYLARQLTSFANGSRDNPIMKPIVQKLTPQQINAVSAYYATLEAPSKTAAAPPAAQQKRGQTLATIGDNTINVQACANCHGPGGSGETPTYPYLAGQHAAYLKASLDTWRKGARTNDPTQQMPQIAKRLSDGDIDAVAAYFAAQPAPSPAAQRTAMPLGSAARPTTAGGTQSGGTPVKGIGSGPSGSNTGNAR